MAAPGSPDYRELLDDDVWDFIEKTEAAFPPEAAQLAVAEQRAFYNAFAASLHAPAPAGVMMRDVVLPAADRSLSCREYLPVDAPADVAILYFRGGGFVFGDLDTHGDICADMAARTGLRVVSADYRLAPEHIHPAALEDALAAFDWIAGMAGMVVLVGESAGGNLAAAVTHLRRGHAALIGQLLIYPGLGGDQTKGSYVEHAQAPLLSTADVDNYLRLRTGGTFDPADATLFPLRAADFSNLPPTVVVVAQCDPLADDGPAYVQSIREAGGAASCRVEPRLTHSFMRARHITGRGKEAFDAIVQDLLALAS